MTKFVTVPRKALKRAIAAALATVVAVPSVFAQTIPVPDVGPGVTFIEALLTPIGLLGAAFLIVSIAIKGWKIMRSV